MHTEPAINSENFHVLKPRRALNKAFLKVKPNWNMDYQTYYISCVCFKLKYGYGCTEYLFQVVSNTKFNFSKNYLGIEGKLIRIISSLIMRIPSVVRNRIDVVQAYPSITNEKSEDDSGTGAHQISILQQLTDY